MPVIETVSIEDVYPLQDEYGNNLASRDYSTKANQDYVRELARSMKAKGIPDEMVTLVRDGGIYRIKAGNSRVEAMKLLGTKTFPAIIDDEDTVQAVIETVVRTNTKKKYEAIEESQFVQQLALFGSDEYVSEVSGIEPEKVAKIRRAMGTVKDAGQDMSLLRMMTIGEFADDPEAVEALTNCTEREYQAIAERYRAKKKRKQGEDELLQAIEQRGIPVVAEAKGMNMFKVVQKVAQIPEELPAGIVAAPHSVPGFYMLMQPAKPAEQVNDEREQGRADFEATRYRQREGTLRRARWIAEKFSNPSGLGTLRNLCAMVREDPARFSADVKSFMQFAEIEDMPVGPADIAKRFMAVNGDCILDVNGKPKRTACQAYVGLLDTMERDGYEPDEQEREIYQTAKAATEGK